MTQEDKNLLLKDLCARLPYGVKVLMNDGASEELLNVNVSTLICNGLRGLPQPYLFPLSSIMTEKQKDYIRNRFCCDWDGEPYEIWRYKIDIEDADSLVDWFNKNHLDYRGLIEKGLAIDATGLNIY